MRRTAVLTCLACALLCASADATQWYEEKQLVPVGVPLAVPASGTLTLQMQRGNKQPIKAECTIASTEALLNTGTQALDETRESVIDCEPASCGAVTVEPVEPWESVLGGDGAPFVLRTGGSATVTCGATDLGALSGLLTPKYGDGDCASAQDDVDNTLEYEGKLTGAMTSETWTVYFSGSEKLGIKGVSRVSGELDRGETCEGGE